MPKAEGALQTSSARRLQLVLLSLTMCNVQKQAVCFLLWALQWPGAFHGCANNSSSFAASRHGLLYAFFVAKFLDCSLDAVKVKHSWHFNCITPLNAVYVGSKGTDLKHSKQHMPGLHFCLQHIATMLPYCSAKRQMYTGAPKATQNVHQ